MKGSKTDLFEREKKNSSDDEVQARWRWFLRRCPTVQGIEAAAGQQCSTGHGRELFEPVVRRAAKQERAHSCGRGRRGQDGKWWEWELDR
jgi:hypothetical protein